MTDASTAIPVMDALPTATIGHNSGLVLSTLRTLDDLEKDIPGYLTAEYPDIVRRLKEIREGVKGLPSRIDSKDDAEKFSDVRGMIKKWVTQAKAARTAEKKPWSAVADAFYAWFSRPIDELVEIDAKTVAPVLEDWQNRELARKRREEEEAARLKREEADKLAREAAEAEARKVEAQRLEREAKEAAERAERERLESIRRAEEAKKAREEEERKAAEARERARLEEIARKERAAKEAEENEARRFANGIGDIMRGIARIVEKAEIEKRREELRRIEQEEKDRAKKLAEERRDQERQAVAARKDIRSAARDERESMDAAIAADKKADKHEDTLNSKAAELTRVRGEHGSVSSLKEFKNFRNIVRAQINWAQVGQFVSDEHLEAAIRAMLHAGIYVIPGVEVFDDTSTSTR